MIEACQCGCGKPSNIAKWNDPRRGAVKGLPTRFLPGHGNRRFEPTHGATGTALYAVYKAARQRCMNPNDKDYKFYGGRGIQFKFSTFEEFRKELGPMSCAGFTVDRKNNEGHYEPRNIRWATRLEQAHNRRKVA